MNPDARPIRRRSHRHLGTGIFLILLGLMLAFENWNGTPFFELGRHWPLILIAFGVGRLVDRGPFAWGPHAAILVGLYFELDRLGHYEWIHRAWPLGFVWLGLILTLRGLRPHVSSASECFHD
ncbi:MAG: hypothetical protein JST05_02195 [Acidobacteria bacterium]|nr:hypothetical protein [Acidobacteriota bacterium]